MRQLGLEWLDALREEAVRDKRDMRDEAAVLIVEALRARQAQAERRGERERQAAAA